MPSVLFYLWLAPVVLAVATLVYAWWDKRRVLIVGHDPETGKEYRQKARPKEKGLRWTKGPGPKLWVTGDSSLMGTHVGRLFERPKLYINARSGNQMVPLTLDPDRDTDQLEQVAEAVQDTATPLGDDVEAGDLPAHVSFLAEKSGARLYADLVESEVAKQAAEANLPAWKSMQATILMVLAFGGLMGYLVAVATGVAA